ncbi:MAG: NAD-dependent epimerase/dehydratase family protein [Xanthomonadaceae bacterium]|nr:NAD-dependent epimerase/dehydratase family protein [Xanthomonadaceae bacterium]
MANKTALVLGSTGLVGSHCLRQLLESSFYERVIALGRRSTGITHPKLVEKLIDFERLSEFENSFKGDDLFYCLGTTIAKAGSQEAFTRVDYEYPLEIAKLAFKGGVKKWLMITSVGASDRSPNFYLRTKGIAEKEISKVGFAETHFFRPSFLLGDRGEDRPLEKVIGPVFKVFAPLMIGPFYQYKPVEASDVAAQMVNVASMTASGMSIHFNPTRPKNNK